MSVASDGTQGSASATGLRSAPTAATWPSLLRRQPCGPGDTNGAGTSSSATGRPAITELVSVGPAWQLAGRLSAWLFLHQRRRPLSWPSSPSRPTSCLATPMSLMTSSSATGRPDHHGVSSSRSGPERTTTAATSPSISADGRYLAFETRVNGIPGGNCLVVQDRQTGYTRWVMGAGGEPFSISADGRCVALKAWADYLAPGNDHQVFGIFVPVDPLGPPTYASLRGTDRYDTAIKVSRAGFPESPPQPAPAWCSPRERPSRKRSAARLWRWPMEAQCFSPPKAELDSRVKAEILRLKPEYVVCVGLSDAIRQRRAGGSGWDGAVSVIRGSERVRHELQGGESSGGEAGRPRPTRCRHHHPGGPLP